MRHFWHTPKQLPLLPLLCDNNPSNPALATEHEMVSQFFLQVIMLTHYRMCEETQQPATQVPKAMVGTIVLNMIMGIVFLVPLLFVFPDQAMLAALASGQPVPTIIKSAVGHAGGAFALFIPLLVLGIICGIGCTTAASRCTWAFSRDGAIPGFQW